MTKGYPLEVSHIACTVVDSRDSTILFRTTPLVRDITHSSPFWSKLVSNCVLLFPLIHTTSEECGNTTNSRVIFNSLVFWLKLAPGFIDATCPDENPRETLSLFSSQKIHVTMLCRSPSWIILTWLLPLLESSTIARPPLRILLMSNSSLGCFSRLKPYYTRTYL